MQENRAQWLHGSVEVRSAVGRSFALPPYQVLQIGEGVEQMLSPALPDREDNWVDFPLTSEMHDAAPKERETGKFPRLRSCPQPWEPDTMKNS